MININELSTYTYLDDLLSEISQSVKATFLIITFTHSGKGKTIETDQWSLQV